MFKFLLRALFGSSSSKSKRSNQPRRPSKHPGSTSAPKPRHLAATSATVLKGSSAHPSSLRGKCYVIDGDTIQIGKVRLRLAGIDAPELEHPWGKKAKWELVKLCKGQIVTAELELEMSYDRVVATCTLQDGRDLSAEMVKSGLALDWPKFSGGKYGHLEPEGSRKKHWKAAAKQRGQMSVFNK